MINPKPVDLPTSPYKIGTLTSPLPATIYQKPPRFPWKKMILLIILSFLVSGVTYGVAEYYSLRNNIIVNGEGNSNGLLNYSGDKNSIDLSKFQSPGDGRFNLLVLGIGGVNDQGVAHDGTLLTDSIQVVSLDTINKKVGITSVPRDFYTTIPGRGPNKINAVYEYGEMDKPGSGGAAAREAFGKVLGIHISNFVVIDFTAAKELIDTLGGVDVYTPTALYDPTYPAADEIHFDPYYLSAGAHHLNGEAALKYTRTRHADSDFGRSKRQQEVIGAMKKKALSLGTLSNPATITHILDILGKHIKTDMQPGEIKSFLSIYKDVTPENTTTAVLDTSEQLGLLTSQDSGPAGYTAFPLGGYTAFGPIHQWFQKNNPDPLISKEGATITVANGGATTKQINTFMNTLKDYGFKATLSTDNSVTPTSAAKIYAKNANDKILTAHYLSSVVGSGVQEGAPLNSGSDFEIIYHSSSFSN